MTNKDFSLFPSPCYIMEEGLLRKNLALIKSVADRAGVEIILAFKSFAMWRSFPIFREYIDHSTASSVYEARLALEEFGSKATMVNTMVISLLVHPPSPYRRISLDNCMLLIPFLWVKNIYNA